ncbi:MAG: serine hydrolase domain-containing protein [Amaricoccus sp.]
MTENGRVPACTPLRGWPSLRPIAAASLLLAAASGSAAADPAMDARIEALVPKLEAYIADGMKAFDDPGLAIGIVSGDRLVYARGFGVARKGGPPVDPETIFQIGSTTKAFLATTLAIGVDRGLFRWDDRVVDLSPEFQLKDPWVSQEFRVFDLLAQRSGMPSYANDMVGLFGADQAQMVHSLRYVDPVTSFRSTFAYTNITHIAAGRMLAKEFGVPAWEDVLHATIFGPLGMTRSSSSAESIEAAANATVGNRYSPDGSVEVPFSPIFPYSFSGAGAINSTVDDLSRWMRLHLAHGSFEGKPIVSPENLAVTKTARVGINDKLAYAMGWVLQATPNGTITWHNGGTPSFGAYIGTALDHDVGVIVLTNLQNVGFPDAIGEWTLDRLLGNPDVDHVAQRLEAAKAAAAASAAAFAPVAGPAPPPPLAPLAGAYTNPAVGDASVAVDGAGLRLDLATGASVRITPRDGGVFTAALAPEGRFKPLVEMLGPLPQAFAQFLADQSGAPGTLRLTFTDDGQRLEFTRK